MSGNKQVCVTFTGHRFVPLYKREELRKRIKTAVLDMYNRGCRHFYCGMAMGFDMMAAEVVVELKQTHHDLELIGVIPFIGQNSRFPVKDKQRYNCLLTKVDKKKILYSSYFKGCLLRRNDYMLEHSSIVIAYYDGKPKGGTYYTCKRAFERNMYVMNLFE